MNISNIENPFFLICGYEGPECFCGRDEEMFDIIYQITDGETWCVQRILNRLYRKAKRIVDEVMIEQAVLSIILSEEEDLSYFSLPYQKKVVVRW